jgi:hypothetical protein
MVKKRKYAHFIECLGLAHKPCVVGGPHATYLRNEFPAWRKFMAESDSNTVPDCTFYLFVWVASLVTAVLLLLHHKYKHSRGDLNQIANQCEQWFQWRDVCNFRTWNHENFIIIFLIIFIIMLVFWAECRQPTALLV